MELATAQANFISFSSMASQPRRSSVPAGKVGGMAFLFLN
jgi:hypothetical protein